MLSFIRSNSAQRSLLRTLLLLLMPVVLAQLAHLGWMVGELMISWTLHLGVCLLLLLPLLWLSLGFRFAIFAAAGALLALTPWTFEQARAARLPPDAPALRIISANTFYRNDKLQVLERSFLRDGAQVVALIEPPDTLSEFMEKTGRWRILAEHLGHNKHNISVLVRAQETALQAKARPVRFDFSPTVMLQVELLMEDKPIELWVVHVPAPTSWSQQAQRDAMHAELLTQLSARTKPVVLLGDYNSTLVSPFFVDLYQRAKLLRPPGPAPATWPSYIGPLGLAIDHALLSPELAARPLSARALPQSDHLGVLLQLGWNRSN